LKDKITPKYALIKIPTINEAAKKTKTQAQTLRIKNEIKFVYKKKQQLNVQLYQAHVSNANIWQNIWNNIEQSIEEKLKLEMEKVYKTQQQKKANMRTKATNNNTTHTRVENYTKIQFTYNEIQLLNKGLKYNLHHKNKKWIETLALEAETATTNLDINKQNYYRHVVAKEIKYIKKNNQINNKKTKGEWKQIMNIKSKIDTNRLIITKRQRKNISNINKGRM
jgi:hypothetical protein